MKKYAFLFALFTSFSSFAQKQTSTKYVMYVGFGVQAQNRPNINDKLHSAGLAKINQILPEFSVGVNAVGKKYSGDIEIATAISNTEANSARSEYLSAVGRLRLHYNVASPKNMLFTAGGNIAYGSNRLNVFSNNNIVDMNNLANNTNVNHTSLRHEMLYIGPSVSLYFLRKSSFPLRLNVAYEVALTRGRWFSDYAAVSNTIGEFGKNRLIISLNIL